jgi:hypothetical protein
MMTAVNSRLFAIRGISICFLELRSLKQIGDREHRSEWSQNLALPKLSGQSGQPDGVALKRTFVVVKVTAFLHVAAMGLADSSFTVSAGEYKRQFPNTGFKSLLSPI